MISVGAPWWLLGLAALALLRELHRLGQAPMQRVPALFPWTGPTAVGASARRQGPPDPRWRRRALIAALLLAALADLGWRPPTGAAPVRVELVATPSLLAIETDGASRAAHAAVALHEGLALAGEPLASLVVVGNGTMPATRIDRIDAAALEALIAAAAERATAPAAGNPTLLPPLPQGVHPWLVTDGTRRSNNRSGYARVVAVGRATENTGIAGLALRLDPSEPGRLQGSVQVHNGGTRGTERRLLVRQGPTVLGDWRMQVAPGSTEVRFFDAERAGDALLMARLEPGDALAMDDRLRLDATALQALPTRIQTQCPPPIRAAVAASPRLIPAAEGPPALLLACADNPPREAPGRVATLWFASTARRLSTPAPPGLLPAPLRLLGAHVRAGYIVETDTTETAALLAGTFARPTVLARPDANRVDVMLDFGDGADGAPALLLDWLLDQLPAALPRAQATLRRGHTGPVAATRPTEDMQIAPGSVPPAGITETTAPSPRPFPAAICLLAALALLLPELTRKASPPWGWARQGV